MIRLARFSLCGSWPAAKRYEFEGVPPETFAAFRSAFAKGRYFNRHIRNRFQYRRTPD
ncbi:KTSC domain-containing protein [Mesorhizobium sp. MSK_1335]|uniref:KTSC domain-containing protein n=1 Tax=Mesorhizobium montanum TaxID=3072323 RepID=A0ABU4ZRE1_9HYPH|nr:KTSC domain-containing protein [Mesorhizobium sp. MSK_1335]MDX8527945.1 KTSC domain-containing protein [Mesorhizobium sp. MSK_1335]